MVSAWPSRGTFARMGRMSSLSRAAPRQSMVFASKLAMCETVPGSKRFGTLLHHSTSSSPMRE